MQNCPQTITWRGSSLKQLRRGPRKLRGSSVNSCCSHWFKSFNSSTGDRSFEYACPVSRDVTTTGADRYHTTIGVARHRDPLVTRSRVWKLSGATNLRRVIHLLRESSFESRRFSLYLYIGRFFRIYRACVHFGNTCSLHQKSKCLLLV